MQKIIDLVDDDWRKFFTQQLSEPYMQELSIFLRQQRKQGKHIFPPAELWFKAFYQLPFQQIKVVIVGQDPYHAKNQAHGLSFSVPSGISFPPSLKNIFKELKTDLNMTKPTSGDLTGWVTQGVFLLNSVLTVESGLPGSHANKGWEVFTQAAIDFINMQHTHVVFLAWGRYAHKVCARVDRAKHLVIQTSHPSPLGANKQGKDFSAFLGSSCFSQANSWLEKNNIAAINWQLD